MQTHYKSGEPLFGIIEDAVGRVNTMAEGRLHIKLNPAGAIVPAGEEFQSTNRGSIDAGACSFSYVAGLSEAFSPFDGVAGGMTPVQFWLWLPYEGQEVIEELCAKFLPDLQFVTSTPSLGEAFASSTKPIETMDDFRKLKFRGTGDGTDILAQMGVPTVFMPSSEIYESVQRGVIDAFESNTFYVNWSRGLNEVADYHYISPARSPWGENSFVVNKAKWAELSPDLQQTVSSGFRDAWQTQVTLMMSVEGEYIQKFIDYGCIVETLPAAVEEEFMAEAEKYYAARRAADPDVDRVLSSMSAWQEICTQQRVR